MAGRGTPALFGGTQKIEVGLAAGPRVDDGGKVAREVVSDASIFRRKGKGKRERGLWGCDWLPEVHIEGVNIRRANVAQHQRRIVGSKP